MENKTQTHTPAPWTFRPSTKPGNGTKWRDIVSTGTEFSPSYIGEALEDDARLIAAAPELLAAVKWAGQCLESYLCADSQEGRDYCRKDLESAHQMACAAIAMAEGWAE